MTLGERIHQMRVEHHLSQGDVAEALDVSRQSVSKWENDGAVPDLDKLVKLSQLFGVSLDQLVLGQGETVEEDLPPPPPETSSKPMGQQIIGVVLLCFGVLVGLLMAFLGNGLPGFAFGMPFYLCGVVCLVARRHPGLWCGWGLFLLVRILLPWVTGFGGFFALVGMFRWGSIQWAVIGLCALVLVALVARTAWCYGRKPMEPKVESVLLAVTGWVIWVGLQWVLLQQTHMYWLYVAFDCLQLTLLNLVAVASVRMVRGRRARQGES